MADILPRLSVVALGARDPSALRRFYRALGWPELPWGDDTWCGFLLGGVLLALYPLAEPAAEAGAATGPPGGWSGLTLACNVDGREQVDTAFAAAVAAGATAVAAPADRDWGAFRYFADPEGNRWEVAWAGSAVFDERGAQLSFG